MQEPVLVLLALPHADVAAAETWHEVVPFGVDAESVMSLRPWSTRGWTRPPSTLGSHRTATRPGIASRIK